MTPRLAIRRRAAIAALLLVSLLSQVGGDLLLGIPAVPVAHAAVGIYKPISYQGKISATNGTAVANNNYNMRFKIFAASTGGNPLWTETWDGTNARVTMTGGLFSVQLGAHVTMTGSVDFNSDSLFLQVEFDPTANNASPNYSETFSPRRRFTSVPYAQNSTLLSGLTSTQFMRADVSQVASGTLTVRPRDATKTGIDIQSIAGVAATAALKLSTQGANHIVFGSGAASYDTNLYRPAAARLKTDGSFWVGGTLSGALLTIMAGNSYLLGNVGIGKTAPATKLDVVGTISGSALTVMNNTSYLMGNVGVGTTSVGTSAIGKAVVIRGPSAQSAILRLEANAGSSSYEITNDDSNLNFVGQNSARGFVWSPVGVEKMRLDYNGNLGIGTTSPGYTFDLSGTGNILRDRWFLAGGAKAFRDSGFGYSPTSYKVIQVGQVGTNRGLALGVDLTGNASGNFSGNEIVLPNGKGVIAPNAANNDYLGILALDTSNKLHIGATNYNILGSSVMVIDSANGNVGIGTASPLAVLHTHTASNNFGFYSDDGTVTSESVP